MKPVLILQHLSGDGPGYLGQWLQARGLVFEVRNQHVGQMPPESLAGYAALAILGGEMSANDELPALRGAERLIREALRDGVPAIGHCLGGQLMARALGAAVTVAPAPEIGWHPMQVLRAPEAEAWFGPEPQHVVFQWHYDTFTPPAGSVLLARSVACAHQAFAIGPLLGMQFHVEIDADKVGRWSREEPVAGGDVEDGDTMRRGLDAHLQAHQRLADRIYARWWALAAAR